jgi:hypothetical protein
MSGSSVYLDGGCDIQRCAVLRQQIDSLGLLLLDYGCLPQIVEYN